MLQLLQPPLHLSSPAALPSDTFSIYSLCVQSSPWGRDAWSRRNAVIPADPTSCTLSLRKWKKKKKIFLCFQFKVFGDAGVIEWKNTNSSRQGFAAIRTTSCLHLLETSSPSAAHRSHPWQAHFLKWSTAEKITAHQQLGEGGVCLSHHHFPLLAIDSPKKVELNSSIWFAAYMSFYLIFQCVW